MPFGSAEVDAEVLYVAGEDEDAFGPAPPAAAAEAKPNTIVLKVVSQYGTEGVLLPPRVPALVHTNAVRGTCNCRSQIAVRGRLKPTSTGTRGRRRGPAASSESWAAEAV